MAFFEGSQPSPKMNAQPFFAESETTNRIHRSMVYRDYFSQVSPNLLPPRSQCHYISIRGKQSMRQFSLVSSTSTCTFVDFLIRWRAPLLSEQTHRKLHVRNQIAPIASARTVSSIQDGISLIGSAILPCLQPICVEPIFMKAHVCGNAVYWLCLTTK